MCAIISRNSNTIRISKMGKVSQEQIDIEIGKLEGWSANGDWIVKEFQFEDFREAMAFMLKASYEAEELNHHPNWSNVYNSVKVELQTHSEGGVTGKDIELARRLNNI